RAAIDRHLSLVRDFFAGDHAEQRRLARAVGTDKPDLFAPLQRRGSVDENDLLAVLLADIFESDHWGPFKHMAAPMRGGHSMACPKSFAAPSARATFRRASRSDKARSARHCCRRFRRAFGSRAPWPAPAPDRPLRAPPASRKTAHAARSPMRHRADRAFSYLRCAAHR